MSKSRCFFDGVLGRPKIEKMEPWSAKGSKNRSDLSPSGVQVEASRVGWPQGRPRARGLRIQRNDETRNKEKGLTRQWPLARRISSSHYCDKLNSTYSPSPPSATRLARRPRWTKWKCGDQKGGLRFRICIIIFVGHFFFVLQRADARKLCDYSECARAREV